MKFKTFLLTTSVFSAFALAATGCKTIPEYELCENEPGKPPCADPVPVEVE